MTTEDASNHWIEPTPGTVAWIVTERDLLRTALRQEQFNRDLAQKLFRKIEASGAWRLLHDMSGKPFTNFEAFCESSNGLGFKRQEIERRLTAQEMAADPNVKPMLKHGGLRFKKQDAMSVLPSRRNNNRYSRDYIVRRLKRDRPDIAEALARGEFPSARAAAVAAGLEAGRALADARYAWKRMSPEERKIFLAEINSETN
jgi:hypothetical protein